MSKDKIPTDGGLNLGHNPFAALNLAGVPSAAAVPAAGRPVEAKPAESPPAEKSGAGTPPSGRNRGRVEIRRETGGRGGKTVTVISGFVGIGQPEKEQLAKRLRAACGCGGTVKDGAIEIQGDQRETVVRLLAEAGFRPVLAGG